MLSLVLHEHFILKTYLGPNQIRQKLSDEIDMGSFQGFVQDNNFEIKRNIHYTNALNPLIKGNFWQERELTKISVSMSPSSSMRLYAVLWLGFAGLIFTCALAMWVLTNFLKDLGEFVRNIGIFLGIGYVLFTTAFNLESVPTKKRLMALFEAI